MGGGVRGISAAHTHVRPTPCNEPPPHTHKNTHRQSAVYGPDQLCDLMAASDYVVAATPHTPETDKIISRAAIAAMRPNGVLVNVGRGKCVDEDALIEGGRACACACACAYARVLW